MAEKDVYIDQVISRNTVNVSGAMVYSNATVAENGYLNVLSGGSAVGQPAGAFVISGKLSGTSRALWGAVNVSNDGYVSGAVISSCGRFYVNSGGLAENIQIVRNGHAAVFQGGLLISATVSGGINDIANVRNAPDYQLTVAGKQTEDAKGKPVVIWAETSHTSVGGGGTEALDEYGRSYQTRVNAAGGQIVLANGLSVQTQVVGGSQIVSSGGVADTTVIAAGAQHVSQGGIAYGTILAGGRQIVSSGGQALGTIVTGGVQELRGGVVSCYESTWQGSDKKDSSVWVYGVISALGSQVIYDGTAVGDRVFGTQIIRTEKADAVATAVSAMIFSGGKQIVADGGRVLNCMYDDGSNLQVSSGGIIAGDLNVAQIGASASLLSGAVIEGKFVTMGEVSLEQGIQFTGDNAGIYLWIDKENADSRNGFAMLHNFNNLGSNAKNCFITAAGDIADGVYTLADGAEGFEGAIGIYNDDWNTPTVYVSTDGKTVNANYIEYTLANNNGTLNVTVVNNTVYDKYLSGWTKSADGSRAETTFTTKYAGRYCFEDFVNASYYGTVSVVDKSGKVIVSLKIGNGRIQDEKKNDFLLNAGTYKLICDIDTPQAFKENAQAHLVDEMVFFRADMYRDDEYNKLLQDEVRITVAADENGQVAAAVSDVMNYYEFVGYGDLKDYRQINISETGLYDLILTKNSDKNSAVKVALYQISGTSLKKVASVSVKDSVDEIYVINQKQLAAGTYYMLVESSKGANGYGTTYGASLIGDIYAAAPEDSHAALSTNEEFDAVKGVTGQVNFASPEVYYHWQVDQAGIYELICEIDALNSVGDNALTVTVFKAPNGKTAMSKVLSFKTKKVKYTTDFESKEVFLTEGDYFISVKSTKINKGADVVWNLSAECDTVYTVPDCEMENVNFVDAEDWVIASKNPEGMSDIYVGYKNPVQWFYLDMCEQAEFGGIFNFTITSSDDSNASVSVTIYQLQDNNKLKKIKSVSVKPDKIATLNNIALSGSGEYFVMVNGVSAGKANKFAEIDITATAQMTYPAGSSGSRQSGDNQIWQLDSECRLDLETPFTGTLGAGDETDFCKLELDYSGYYNFQLVSEDKNAKLTATLFKWNADGSGLTKVTSLSLATKATEVELKKDLLLEAGDYYLSVNCADVNKGGYGKYSLSIDAGTIFDHDDVNNSDDNYAAAKEIEMSYNKDRIDIVGQGAGFVGYGDNIDFILLQDVISGTYDFQVQTSANVKFTLYRYDEKSNKLVSLSGTKSFKAGSNNIAGLHLESDVDYYIAVQANDSKSEVIYSLSATADTAGVIEAQYNKDSYAEIDPMRRNTVQKVNFEVADEDAGWLYSFDNSTLGNMELFMYNESKGTLKKVKMSAGSEIKLAAGSYYIQLEANQLITQMSYLTFDADSRSFAWTSEKPENGMMLA